ncbi:hypothetical protein ASPFODRAFT_82212 [Aspergillus luchuensis CBS 106.47]|uniref:Tyrosinase copper-binding domain-containing protein n=1 Tax=Aspergillus luchuensis (strain CBS 106.47) TaxID=1137211 RepID=A0A1M3TED3_ASPLC|nr:hypothetical protein ASPFODRAFT_82212 [Aspergillus luchuensis CBS 106.47]
MLKEKCNSMFCTKFGQTFKPKLTNGDILTALIWISVTRAKQASSPTTPKDTLSTLSCLVEIRSILHPKLGTYIGNAMMTTQCVLSTQSTSRKTTDPIADISFIREVALQIRNEIRSITTEQATRYVSHINTLDDWSSFQAQWAELFVSSIRHFDAYGLNFGSVLGPVANFEMCLIRGLVGYHTSPLCPDHPATPSFFLYHGFIDQNWWAWQSADPDNRLYQLSGYTTESEPSTGWVDVTLDYNPTSYEIIPDATIEQILTK